MRCFYLIFILYICESYAERKYRIYNNKSYSTSSFSSSPIRRDDGEGFSSNKQSDDKNIRDSQSDSKRYGVEGKDEAYTDINRKNNSSDHIKIHYNNDGIQNNRKPYDDEVYNNPNKDAQIYDREVYLRYGLSFYGYGGNRKNISNKQYSGKEYDARRIYEANERCRYIGPLDKYKTLDKFEYQNNERFDQNVYGYEDFSDVDFYNDNKDQDQCDQRYDGTKEEIIRPCNLNDWECIRKFLATNSGCKPAYGPNPDPMYIPVDKFFLPLVNVTVTHTNLRIKGFESARITEFHLNKETGNVVIAIEVKNFDQSSPRSYFTYQRRAKEPIVLSDFTTVLYKSITFTAVLPYFPHLRLDKAEIHADVDGSRPVFVIGPGIFNSTDPAVVTSFAELNLNVPTMIQEAIVFHSFLVTGVYIQRSICDFGVDVYGNYLRFLRTKGFVVGPYNNNKDYSVPKTY